MFIVVPSPFQMSNKGVPPEVYIVFIVSKRSASTWSLIVLCTFSPISFTKSKGRSQNSFVCKEKITRDRKRGIPRFSFRLERVKDFPNTLDKTLT